MAAGIRWEAACRLRDSSAAVPLSTSTNMYFHKSEPLCPRLTWRAQNRFVHRWINNTIKSRYISKVSLLLAISNVLSLLTALHLSSLKWRRLLLQACLAGGLQPYLVGRQRSKSAEEECTSCCTSAEESQETLSTRSSAYSSTIFSRAY